MQTLQAIIEKDGSVRLLEPIYLSGSHRAIVTVLDSTPEPGLRPYGLAKGEFVVPDDFNDPLPDDLLGKTGKIFLNTDGTNHSV